MLHDSNEMLHHLEWNILTPFLLHKNEDRKGHSIVKNSAQLHCYYSIIPEFNKQ